MCAFPSSNCIFFCPSCQSSDTFFFTCFHQLPTCCKESHGLMGAISCVQESRKLKVVFPCDRLRQGVQEENKGAVQHVDVPKFFFSSFPTIWWRLFVNDSAPCHFHSCIRSNTNGQLCAFDIYAFARFFHFVLVSKKKMAFHALFLY